VENRCSWCGEKEVYINYHDQEWGVPEYNSRALWEKLVLDGFQAGLSWLTILKKRDAFREAFAKFDPVKVATFDESDVERLLQDTGIVRHRGKIMAAIRGAQVWQEIEAREGFDTYLWKYLDGNVLQNQYERMDQVPTFTPLSTRISKDLKKEGFNFVGPTIVYAFMEAVGMINDHMITCPRHGEVQNLARKVIL